MSDDTLTAAEEQNASLPSGGNEPPEPEGLDQPTLSLGAFPIDSLMIRTEMRSVFETVRRIDSANYIMDPDFQRDFVWELKRQSKLIESAILRIPLPVFYLAEMRGGKIVVVDGLQRLTTFHRYLKGHFSLTGLEFASELNGKKFTDLAPALQNRIEDTQLTLYLIDAKVPEQAKYEIFDRVNSGVALTRQQMRNCLFVGEGTHWLGKMAKSEAFIAATELGLNWRTMRDRECINRFAGFYLLGEKKYQGDMDRFLSETLIHLNENCGIEEFDRLTQAFELTMRRNRSLFGRHAFRTSMQSDHAHAGRAIINVALFDVFSVLLADLSDEILEKFRAKLVAGSRELLADWHFIESITRSTNSTKRVQYRFQAVRELLTSLTT